MYGTPPVGIARIRVKVWPKISSHRAGWTARVYSSVRSWRSFCSSTAHRAATRTGSSRQPARGRGGLSSSWEPSADTVRGAAGASDIAETSSAVVVEAAAGDVAEDVLQRGQAVRALAFGQSPPQLGRGAEGADAAAVH